MNKKYRAKLWAKSFNRLFTLTLILMLSFFIAKASQAEREVASLLEVNSSLSLEVQRVSEEVASLKETVKAYDTTITVLQSEVDKLIQENIKLADENAKLASSREPYRLSDLTYVSHATAEQIDSHLAGTPLAGMGKAYVEAESKYGVNAFFIASVSIWESGWGKSRLAQEKHNLFGYGAYNESFEKAYRFESFEQCIDQVALRLKESYLTAGGKYYSGVGIEQVNKRYAVRNDGSANTDWSRGISSIMRQLAISD